MHKSLRIIVVIVVIAGLLALGTVLRRRGLPVATETTGYLQQARALASQAYEKIVPLVSIQYWRDWAREQDSLAGKPPPKPIIVIRHVHQHNARLAALEPPPPPSGPSPPSAAPNPVTANAGENVHLHIMSKDFEGCWQGTVNQPGSWEYVEGPEPSGWSPATYTLCLHHPGPSIDASVAVDTSIHLVSQWVVPWTGARNEQTAVILQSPDLVVLRATGEIPMELKVMGFLPGPKPLISYTDYFRCSVQSGKLDVVATLVDRCDGSTVENCRGQPWIRESWHQQLTRLSQ